jgi:hypothetical protein
MLLTAVVTKAELAALIDSFTPLRITIDDRRGRTVTLGRPALELVPGHGLRLRGDARIAWDVAGVPLPVTIQAWQLLLVPRIAARGRSRLLAFDPVVEELDLKRVPGFLDDKIADAITDGIAQNRGKLAWDFSRTLSKRLALPARVAPAGVFEIMAVAGGVAVTENDLTLQVRFEARVEKRAPAKAEEPAPHSAPLVPARAAAR